MEYTSVAIECIPVNCGVTNLIHDRRIVALISRLKSRQMWLDVSTQAWTSQAWNATVGYETLPTSDSIVEIGRKSRSLMGVPELLQKEEMVPPLHNLPHKLDHVPEKIHPDQMKSSIHVQFVIVWNALTHSASGKYDND